MHNLMDKIIDVTGGQGGNSHLIIGENKTALIDCGMAYCASELINNIKEKLKDNRKLDYIFLSHSHYDHAGAIPYLRSSWPEVKVLAAEHAYNILNRSNALKLIRELGNMAGKYYGYNKQIDYDDNLLKVDQIIYDGQKVDLGNIIVSILETPGHTKCSLSFVVQDLVFFASETTGCLAKSGKINTSFINSYKDSINSINKCENTKAKYVISQHNDSVIDIATHDYWQRCLEATKESKEFILKFYNDGFNEEKIYEEYKNKYFDEELKLLQPEIAFEINNKAMIRIIINEITSSCFKN